MPIYEYKCDSCGQQFELIQRFSDAPLTQHDACGGSVHRLLSAPALQFKGSGFYITDYSKSGSKPAGGNGSGKNESKSGESKGGESKGESKSSSSDSGSSSSSSSSSSSGTAGSSSSSSDKK